MISTEGFRKSTFSGNGGCVEVRLRPDGMILLRDAKDVSRPEHEFTAREWAAFIAGVKVGEFDLS